MLKFKLPQCPIRPRELFPLPVDSFPSPARPFPTHMEVMFSPWGSPPPSLCVDTTLGAFGVIQFRLYQHHKLNITPCITTILNIYTSLNFKLMYCYVFKAESSLIWFFFFHIQFKVCFNDLGSSQHFVCHNTNFISLFSFVLACLAH